MRQTRRLVPVLLLVVLAGALVPVLSSARVGSVDLSDDLILQYDFEGRYGDNETVYDESSSNTHGVYVGHPPNGTNGSDDALQFSNESGYVAVEFDERRLAGDFTVTTRVRNPQQAYYAGIVASEQWRLVAPYDRYGFLVGDSGVSYGEATPGEWYRLAAVHRNGTVGLYVNGQLVDSARVSANLSVREVLVGRRPGGYWFGGEIDEVSIYGRALTESEIRAVATGEGNVRPVFYSDAFRSVALFGVVLTAVLLAVFEARFRRHE